MPHVAVPAAVRRTTLSAIRDITRPGGGVLHCGAGGDSLLETLLAEGIEARGVDISPGVVRVPGRFTYTTAGTLPFDTGRFATVVASPAWLEQLDERALDVALRELARVARDNVILETTGEAIASEGAAGECRPRTWWEQRLFCAGLRRHTRLFGIVEFESMEYEAAACIVMQKIPAPATVRHPLDSLRAERDLHMDMLRETGRRSDAHVARYEWARGWIKPGDVVADAACGLGYGSAVLWDGSEASRVVGLDLSESAVRYAHDCFTPGRPGLEFRVADAEAWEGWDDDSVDCVVSFETIEHLPNPGRFIRGVQRVLKPGGRFLCSVPNEWVDETGCDPNPYHLHVFNLDRLVEVVSPALLVDEVYMQSAGGHAGGFDPRRRLRSIEWPSPGGAAEQRAEWWLLSAVKDPCAVARRQYVEQVFPAGDAPVPNAIAFARDYLNPWAVHALVLGCFRVRSPRLLRELAERWLESSPAGSADAGAALCILAYRALEGPHSASVTELLSRVAEYCAGPVSNAQARRWQISLRFVAGLLHMRRGEFTAAEACLRQCAGDDASAFTPHLETKTTHAAWLAGRLALERGDADRAAADWTGVYEALERIRAVPVSGWAVSPSRPAAFEVGDGLPEIATAIDNAILSTNALRQLRDPAGAWRPGSRPLDQNMRQRVNRLVDVAGLAWAAADRAYDSEQRAWKRAQEVEERWQADRPDVALQARSALRERASLRVGIFGTGAGAFKVAEALSQIDFATVVWFADNDPARHGRTMLWVDVIAPAEMHARAFDVVVIGSMSVGPISSQLQALGVRHEQIIAPDVTAALTAIVGQLRSALATARSD